MAKFKDYMVENTKAKLLTEMFIKYNEITKMPAGKERDAQIARLAMIAELDASNLYEGLIPYTKDKDLKKLLQDVSSEEKVHAGEFEYALEQIDPTWEDLEDEGEEEAEEKTKEKK